MSDTVLNGNIPLSYNTSPVGESWRGFTLIGSNADDVAKEDWLRDEQKAENAFVRDLYAQDLANQFSAEQAEISRNFDAVEAQKNRDYNALEAAKARSHTTYENELNRQYNTLEAEKTRQFNAEEAQKQRDYEERLANSAYSRAVSDMKNAGINPILGLNMANLSADVPSGSAASGNAASYSSSGGSAAASYSGAGRSSSPIGATSRSGRNTYYGKHSDTGLGQIIAGAIQIASGLLRRKPSEVTYNFYADKKKK